MLLKFPKLDLSFEDSWLVSEEANSGTNEANPFYKLEFLSPKLES